MALVNQVFRHLSCFCWSSLECHVVWEISSSLGSSKDLFFFLKIGPFLFIYSFISGCNGSPLLHGFLQLQRGGLLLSCGAQASRCGGCSCCGARALGKQASVVAAPGLLSCGFPALDHAGFSS